MAEPDTFMPHFESGIRNLRAECINMKCDSSKDQFIVFLLAMVMED